MIGQAFFAEWFKALRQPRALFWAYLFTPLAGLLLGTAGLLFIHSFSPAAAAANLPSPMKSLMDACGDCRNPAVLLFLIVGAAGLFAGEYRWLTWRYLLVRNTRLNLMAAKFAVFMILGTVTLLLFMAGGLLTAAFNALLNHTSYMPSSSPTQVLAAFGVALLYLASVGALTALASVISRNLTGAIVAITVLLLVIVFAEGIVTSQNVVWAQNLLPGIAYGRLSTAIQGLALAAANGPLAGFVQPPQVNVAASLAVLIGWAVIPFGAACLLFSRQDLSRE